MKIWYSDPTHVRLAVPVQMSETDLIRNGQHRVAVAEQSNTVTKKQLPAKAEPRPQARPVADPLTPQQAAQQALAAVGPTTRVSVTRHVTVAGPGRLRAGPRAQEQRLADRPGDASRWTRST